MRARCRPFAVVQSCAYFAGSCWSVQMLSKACNCALYQLSLGSSTINDARYNALQ